MPKFLFWNLNKKPLCDFVRHLAHEQDVDVLILAECAFSKDGLLEELNREVAEYRYAWGVSDHLVKARFSLRELRSRVAAVFAEETSAMAAV